MRLLRGSGVALVLGVAVQMRAAWLRFVVVVLNKRALSVRECGPVHTHLSVAFCGFFVVVVVALV